MNKKNIYKFYNYSKSGNYIVAAAIGNKAISEWKSYAFKTWMSYCKNNDIGLLVFKNYIIEKKDPFWKIATWQKNLFPEYILQNIKSVKITNICLLDLDILINPFSPNIFKNHPKNKISLVSQLKNLPYDNSDNIIRRKIAFLRNFYYDKKFPLDSSLTMSNKKTFKFHGFKDPGNYFCIGVMVFNVKKFARFFSKMYFDYKPGAKSITGGNEPHINYEIQKKCKINWLNYRFQALWNFEVTEKYPFLYNFKKKKNKIIQKCVESSLMNTYFLHFAGSWYDSGHWKIKNIFLNDNFLKMYKKLIKYQKIKLKNKAHRLRIIPKGLSGVQKI